MSSGNLGADLQRVGDMSLEDLRGYWRERLGEAAPQLRARELLALALAYRLQAKVYGDLPGPAKRRAAELARRFEADRGYTPITGPALKPGMSLIKAWRGVRHEVRVLEVGFSYQGERLGSLSEAAQRITGTKWNGHRFFGLKEGAR